MRGLGSWRLDQAVRLREVRCGIPQDQELRRLRKCFRLEPCGGRQAAAMLVAMKGTILVHCLQGDWDSWISIYSHHYDGGGRSGLCSVLMVKMPDCQDGAEQHRKRSQQGGETPSCLHVPGAAGRHGYGLLGVQVELSLADFLTTFGKRRHRPDVSGRGCRGLADQLVAFRL